MTTARERRAEEARRTRTRMELEWRGGQMGGWTILCPNGHSTVRSFTHHKKKLGTVAVSWSCTTCGASFGQKASCLECGQREGHTDWCPTGRAITNWEAQQCAT
jgi:hypothetical protein